jgi:glycosyltransferase involved in cell wall biosynthesis
VLVEYVFLSACLAHIRRAAGDRPHPPLTIIDAHDVMHRRLAALAAAEARPQWFHTSPAEEARGLARADLVLAIHEDDARTIRDLLPGRAVLTVPHGRAVHPLPAEQATPTGLLYVASHNDLNVRGLERFLLEVWPRIAGRLPAAELTVCGNIADKLHDLPRGVVARGVVPALRDEYGRARVVIDPVVAATGLQIKVVEALCHGRPVVVTPAGAAGLDTGVDAGVLVADTPATFADAILGAMEKGVLWDRLIAGAAAQARRRFSPATAFGPLLQHIERARADRARPGAR